MNRFVCFSAFFVFELTLTAICTAQSLVNEIVYVETPLDTDQDGQLDRLYVRVKRPDGQTNLPVIFKISPYAQGGNDVGFHGVDVNDLPQDRTISTEKSKSKNSKAIGVKKTVVSQFGEEGLERGYADVDAHSLGTGNSKGCPSVGDEAETLAAKSVIDWLNGRAKGYSANGTQVYASWSNGSVGMIGVSYNGTLPNMVATTGVEGLKAIIPVSAISNWYNYYRSNGLVVGPGGYIGEDADILGKFIVRSGACQAQVQQLTQDMGREHGDFTEFWRKRNYLSKASQVRAAVFIMHGQSDWNVRQRHAIEWWDALEGVVPRRMWLHRGGHDFPRREDLDDQIWAWFDRYVKGEDQVGEVFSAVEVQSPNGTWTTQTQWPSERTQGKVFYLNQNHSLSEVAGTEATARFVDMGKTQRIEDLLPNPGANANARLSFVSNPFTSSTLMSGTPKINMALSVLNRRAANITVAVVDYDASGRGSIVTRGWMDPQNHQSIESGELLVQGEAYQLSFSLEPKQYTFAAGHRLGIIVAATDFDHTIRPNVGSEIAVQLGVRSNVELRLSGNAN